MKEYNGKPLVEGLLEEIDTYINLTNVLGLLATVEEKTLRLLCIWYIKC